MGKTEAGWNHRAVRRKLPNGEVEFFLTEAHYKRRGGKVVAIMTEPLAPSSDTFEGLRWTVQQIGKAFARGVVDYDSLRLLPMAVEDAGRAEVEEG